MTIRIGADLTRKQTLNILDIVGTRFFKLKVYGEGIKIDYIDPYKKTTKEIKHWIKKQKRHALFNYINQ